GQSRRQRNLIGYVPYPLKYLDFKARQHLSSESLSETHDLPLETSLSSSSDRNNSSVDPVMPSSSPESFSPSQ
ncbi:hypothetical protein A2U01_0092806, partial [Trifolium medium]|nr:hypothetical protein [Trifolium medium]